MFAPPSPTPSDQQNPYQSPQVLAPTYAATGQDGAFLAGVLRNFRSQVVALGVLWIFVGTAALVMGVVFAGYLSDFREVQDPIHLGILGTAGLTWIVLGVLVCLKQTWALHVALTLSYLSLLGNLVWFQWPAIFVIAPLILVIMQAHRVLNWARELTRAGIPLTTSPEHLQVKISSPT